MSHAAQNEALVGNIPTMHTGQISKQWDITNN